MSDMIYRQDAIDYFFRPYSNEESYSNIDIERILKSLPSAEPEPQFYVYEDMSDVEILSELRSKYSCFNEYEEPVYHALSEAIKALAEPEIIRCRDCKYASPNAKYGCKAYHFKLYETHEMNADDFCSHAERREDEQAD